MILEYMPYKVRFASQMLPQLLLATKPSHVFGEARVFLPAWERALLGAAVSRPTPLSGCVPMWGALCDSRRSAVGAQHAAGVAWLCQHTPCAVSGQGPEPRRRWQLGGGSAPQ